ncbi:MAG: hypothetical protein AAGI72_23550 [Pseudomonadota bacterium]
MKHDDAQERFNHGAELVASFLAGFFVAIALSQIIGEALRWPLGS